MSSVLHGSPQDGTGNVLYLHRPAGKRSAPPSSLFLLLIRSMESGSLWADPHPFLLYLFLSIRAGNKPGMSAGQGSVLNWVLLMDCRDYPRYSTQSVLRKVRVHEPFASSAVLRLSIPTSGIKTRSKNSFPRWESLTLRASLKERGIPVTVEDCTFETFDEVIDRIAESRPAIIGISIMITMSRNAFSLLKELQGRLPGTLFVAGGPLPTVNPAMFAQRFDLVFCGEGDVTFPRFCQDYLTSGSSPHDLKTLDPVSYPGLYMSRDGQVRSSPPVHHPSEILDRLPLPDRSGFDHHQYQSAMEKNTGLKQTSLIVTRGCPFSCDFCSKPVWGDLFRKPPLEKVFREIEEIRSLRLYQSLDSR